jgi:hypothetical protein
VGGHAPACPLAPPVYVKTSITSPFILMKISKQQSLMLLSSGHISLASSRSSNIQTALLAPGHLDASPCCSPFSMSDAAAPRKLCPPLRVSVQIARAPSAFSACAYCAGTLAAPAAEQYSIPPLPHEHAWRPSSYSRRLCQVGHIAICAKHPDLF